MIIHIEAVGNVPAPGINLWNRVSVIGKMTSMSLALCEISFKRKISGYWFVNEKMMTRVSGPGELAIPIDFILDINTLDWDSVLLMLGTIEGYYRSAVSALGFNWEIQLVGKNHAVTIGYNEGRDKNCLPVTIVEKNDNDDIVCEEIPQILLREVA